MKVTGQVVNLSNKTISPPGKRPFKVHYVELDNGKIVNVGFKQPFDVGQTISIDAEISYGELKMGAMAPSSGAPGSSVTPIKQGYSSGKNDKFPVPRTHGDYSIIRQNALTNAVNAWSHSHETTTGLTDEDVEEIIKIAYKFAEFSSGHREEKVARELALKTVVNA